MPPYYRTVQQPGAFTTRPEAELALQGFLASGGTICRRPVLTRVVGTAEERLWKSLLALRSLGSRSERELFQKRCGSTLHYHQALIVAFALNATVFMAWRANRRGLRRLLVHVRGHGHAVGSGRPSSAGFRSYKWWERAADDDRTPVGRFLGQPIGWRGAFLCVAPEAVLTSAWQSLTVPSMPSHNGSIVGFSWRNIGTRPPRPPPLHRRAANRADAMGRERVPPTGCGQWALLKPEIFGSAVRM